MNERALAWAVGDGRGAKHILFLLTARVLFVSPALDRAFAYSGSTTDLTCVAKRLMAAYVAIGYPDVGPPVIGMLDNRLLRKQILLGQEPEKNSSVLYDLPVAVLALPDPRLVRSAIAARVRTWPSA